MSFPFTGLILAKIKLHEIQTSENNFSGHVTHYMVLNNSRIHLSRPEIFLVRMVIWHLLPQSEMHCVISTRQGGENPARQKNPEHPK